MGQKNQIKNTSTDDHRLIEDSKSLSDCGRLGGVLFGRTLFEDELLTEAFCDPLGESGDPPSFDFRRQIPKIRFN